MQSNLFFSLDPLFGCQISAQDPVELVVFSGSFGLKISECGRIQVSIYI